MEEKEQNAVFGKYLVSFIFLAALFILFVGMIRNAKEMKDSFVSGYNTAKTKAEESGDSKTTDVFQYISAGLTSAEKTVNTNIAGRSSFIDLHGLTQAVLCRKVVQETKASNWVYKMDNGQLTYSYPKYSVVWVSDQFKALKNTCDSLGMDFLYVQWPCKINKYNNQLPHGMEDNLNYNADALLARLKKYKIATVDYREVLHEKYSDEEYASLFYNTDHHWRTETAFDAYLWLLQYFEEHYGLSYDEKLLDRSQYSFRYFPQSFIGSLANRVGTLYAGVDDFCYIVPNFDTDMVWERYYKYGIEKSLTRTGTFEEAVLFKEVMDDETTPLPYRDNCYMRTNPPLAKITNNNVEGGRILWIGDSYSKPIVSFLSLAVNHIEFIDLRDFATKPVDYLQEHEFDQVVVAYYPGAIKGATAEFFHFAPKIEYTK